MTRRENNKTADKGANASTSRTTVDESSKRVPDEDGPQHPLLDIQQLEGNQAVQRLIEEGGQSGLWMGRPGDRFEREANRVAVGVLGRGSTGQDRVLARTPKAGLQRRPAHGRIEGGGEPVARNDESTPEWSGHGETHPVQRQKTRWTTPGVDPALARYLAGGVGQGKPLPAEPRTAVESYLDRDFGAVRVHDDPAANRVASAIDARAFTHGTDVFFARDESLTDLGLLAHELTHVVQQRDGNAPPIQRNPDGVFTPEVGATPPERAASDGIREPITGPLAPGTRLEGADWSLIQFSEDEMMLWVGGSSMGIFAPRGERYGYHIEPRGVEEQLVVRVVHTPGVYVSKNIVPGDPAELVVHQRTVGDHQLRDPGYFDFEFGIMDLPVEGDGRILSLDDSYVTISVPRQPEGFLEDEFPDAKYAYSVDPEWTGPEGNQKIVHIVATPGVTVESGVIDTPDLGSSFEMAFGQSGYGRVLVPNLVRVQDPERIPEQGMPFEADDFIGYQRFIDSEFQFGSLTGEPEESPIGVYTGTSGVTVKHEWSGASLTLRPKDPIVGARFAYQIIPPSAAYPGEIRAVVGPGVTVELREPVPRSDRSGGSGMFGQPTPPPGRYRPGEAFEEERVQIEVVEVPASSQVPSQGTPINLNYYYSIGGTRREPDVHEYLETSEIPYLAADVAVGMIPVFGDIVDIGEFALAMFTDKDRWGRPVTTTDKVLMGVGALIGLIPFVGGAGGLLRGGAKAGVELTELASRTGKSVEQLEVVLARVRRVVDPADAAVIRRAEEALKRGGEIAVEDVETISRLSKQLGGTGLPTRLGLNMSPGSLGEFGPGALRIEDEAIAWRRGLNADTRRLLNQNPSLARKFEEMPSRVRRVLTKCGSECLPLSPPPTSEQVARVERLIEGLGGDDMQRLRSYFYAQRDNLEGAIAALEEANKRRGGLVQFIREGVDDIDAVLLPKSSWQASKTMRKRAGRLLSSGDISIERLAAVMRGAASTGAGGDRILRYLETLLRKKPQGYEKVIGDFAAGHNFFRGAEWVIRYVDTRGLWKNLEALEVTAELGGRRWDASIGGVLYEFKNWGKFYGNTFVRQVLEDYRQTGGFTSRGLRWVFEPRLGNETAVRAAAEQSLKDAMRRELSSPGLSEEAIKEINNRYDDIISYLDTIIHVPMREMVSLR